MVKTVPKPTKPAASLLTTLTVLALMLGTGVVAALIGYFFGQNALKGTTQPVVNPILGVGSPSQRATNPSGEFVSEKDVIARVEAQTGNAPAAKPSPAASPKSTASPSPTAAGGFPMATEADGVKLEIRSAKRDAGELVLDVALTNSGTRSVQFIYTFLDITNDKGQALTAITQGLPTDLQPKGPTFTGKIQIPEVALEGAKKISLSLADYPNQELRLQIPNIPVSQ